MGSQTLFTKLERSGRDTKQSRTSRDDFVVARAGGVVALQSFASFLENLVKWAAVFWEQQIPRMMPIAKRRIEGPHSL